MQKDLFVIIPVYNEEKNIGYVLDNLLKNELFNKDQILVVDNASTDKTKEVINFYGVHYSYEKYKGYGAACKNGVEYIRALPIPPLYIIFMDGDGSDNPQDIPLLFKNLKEKNLNLIIGARKGDKVEKNSLSHIQIFGNTLICRLILFFFIKNLMISAR